MGYFIDENVLASSDSAASSVTHETTTAVENMDCSESSSVSPKITEIIAIVEPLRVLCNAMIATASTSTDTIYSGNVISPKQAFVCDDCHEVYASKILLIRCILTHEKLQNPLICAKCGKKFTKMSHARIHKRMHLNKAHRCPFCQKVFSRYKMLEVHHNMEHI